MYDFGPISFLINKFMLPFLTFCYNNIYSNYGVAIILLTIFIKLAFFPLMKKQYESMSKMQEISPKMKDVRQKYKDNPQKMQQEIISLYKKYNVNPLQGCLPMLIQIPFFIAIYGTILSETFKELIFAEGVNPGLFPFWLSDLSLPDSTLILPIILAGFTYYSQKLMMVDPAQQKMLIITPIMILFFGLKLPSGVLIYWAAQTIITTLQQLAFIKKKDEGGNSSAPQLKIVENKT
tara:strand:+ start:625 stop:1329 length:705 start_codon:yes stop_codon:yes gene_type:complete